MPPRSTALLAAALLALAACGGDDRKDAEQTVRDFVKATNERAGERFCGELVTEEYLRQTTGETGSEAIAICTRQLDAIEGLELALVGIRRTELDGDAAQVTAALERHGRSHMQTFRLEREDGAWKLSGGSGTD